MKLNPDYADMFKTLNTAGVKYLMDLGSIPFKEAWTRKTTAQYGEEKVYFISREDLITVKKASGRPQDLDDVKDLKKSRSVKKGGK